MIEEHTTVRTTLRGPYDNLTTFEKKRVCGMIPTDVYDRVFRALLPQHGAQSKIIGALFERFHAELESRYANGDDPLAATVDIINNVNFKRFSAI